MVRALRSQCEILSGEQDLAYHAARAYFDPTKKDLPSLFTIILRVLHDVRSVLICANVFAAVQSNYVRLQSLERPGAPSELIVLAKFDDAGKPTVGAMQLFRGVLEGFPRLLASLGEVQCTEEISQLGLEDIVQEFPECRAVAQGNTISIYQGAAPQPVATARRIPVRTESLPATQEFHAEILGTSVITPSVDGQVEVLTTDEETDLRRRSGALFAHHILRPGMITSNTLPHTFREGVLYGAPYSRFRFTWMADAVAKRPPSAEDLRREVSHLLFAFLSQMKFTHMRIAQDHMERRQLRLENIELRREIARERGFAGVVGESREMQALYRIVRSVAETDVTVLIRGETGTGKELIARAIHHHSPRREHRFVAINCGALSETLLESELFGHEKGAFTGAIAQRKGVFELADGGTLILDEIGEVSPSTQVKLLRVLQEGEFQRVGGSATIRVNVRIVAATNQNVEELVRVGRMRQDLYYRLNVFPINVPPLRERKQDIFLLVSHFIEKWKRSLDKEITGISPAAMALLMAYNWPGNIRELENVVQRMMVIAQHEVLDIEYVPDEIRGMAPPPLGQPGSLKGIARESAGKVERQTILDTLARTGGNVTRAAKVLGISRATLQNKMKAYGLRSPHGMKGSCICIPGSAHRDSTTFGNAAGPCLTACGI